MLPCSHQIDESLTSRIDIEPFDQLCVLGGDTPVAFSGLAGSAQVASQSKQSGCSDIAGIRTQRNGLDHICGGANAAADDQRNMISDSFVTQTLIHSSQRKFYGDSHIVTNTGGGGSSAAAEPVNGNDVCSAAGDPAGDGSDVVYSGYLDDDGFLVICRFFQGIDQLPQIFDGINIVVRRGRNRICAFRHHSGAGYISYDLGPGQMATDTGFCTLSHLDLDSGSGFQILFVYAEAPGCHLNNGVFAIGIKIFVQPAFAGVIADAQFLRCFGKTGMSVVADGAVAHGGEHNRHGKFDLRRQLTFEPSFFISPDTVRLLPQEHSGFHGFAQRVNGRVRYLRRVDQNSVPINRITFRVSHGG